MLVETGLLLRQTEVIFDVSFNLIFINIYNSLFYSSKQHFKFFKSSNFCFPDLYVCEHFSIPSIRITIAAIWCPVKVSYKINKLHANISDQFRIFRKVLIRPHSRQHNVKTYKKVNPPVEFNRD